MHGHFFLFQPFFIPSSSMEPGLIVGDRIFASKYDYGYSRHSFPFSLPIIKEKIFESSPQRGDVVIFKPPHTRNDYIKRLIGLPGDKIKIVNGIIHINPGSPNLPHNYSHRLGIVGIIDIKGQHLNAELVHLGDLPDLVNPSLKGLVIHATKTDEGIRVNGLANFKPTGI